jgi:hypothetical protein
MTTVNVQQVNRAEAWQTVYQAVQQVNFAAWDFDSIKKSLLDYLKTYYTEEDFNDYIESSELIAILEIFAYVAEMLAYRQDLNAHENIISVADRKESALRLAKQLSYNASRNIPARGLVKLTSVSTTETLYDSNGNNLTNTIVNWNDRNNTNWKDQFLLIMNRIMSQPFGSVLPSDRTQVQDVVFELYPLNNNPLTNNVIAYTVNVSGTTYPMELVSSALDPTYGPYETRPELDLIMNILYLSDGLGDASDNTGFFFYTKQGTIQLTTTTFDGILPNQTFDIAIDNQNNTDLWVNNVDSTTGEIIVGDGSTTLPAGAWVEVDVANSQNIVFNTNPNMNKYEVETLANDQIRLIFGDGNFAAIPSGDFQIWTRVSANADLVIPTSAIQAIQGTVPYTDATGTSQTFSFTFSLVDSIQNSAPSEGLDHIKRIAPAYYYSQGRMVNGQDYNTFPLQDNTILKLNAINRTFAGDSKYIAWHDPREYYDNVKVFGDDGVLYFNPYTVQQQLAPSQLPQPDFGANTALTSALITNFIAPILQGPDYYQLALLSGVIPSLIRTTFNAAEIANMAAAFSAAVNAPPKIIYLNYNLSDSSWEVYTSQPPSYWISVQLQSNGYWLITLYSLQIMFHSNGVNFWITNDSVKTVTYDTQNGNYDEIVVLAANIAPNNTIVGTNYPLYVAQQYVYDAGVNKGLPSVNDLIVVPGDTNGDGIPDNVTLSYIIGPNNYVYFNRACNDTTCGWTYVPYSAATLASWQADQTAGTGLWIRYNGVENVNFLWMHRTPKYHLVDPSPSNIIDMYIITRGYYTSVQQWLNGELADEPQQPSGYELRGDYASLLESKMISDTVLPQSGNFKLLFGPYADETLQATLAVVRTGNTTLTDNQVKTQVVDQIQAYFDINNWDFGQTFYWTNLSTYITTNIPNVISSIVPVPLYSNTFGALFQVFAREDEIILPNISTDQISIVTSLDPVTLKQF